MKTPINEITTLLNAVGKLSIPDVQRLLLAGENPNQPTTSNRSDEPKLLLQAVLDDFSLAEGLTKKKYRIIAQLLWIFKGVTQIDEPYKDGQEYLQKQRAKLSANYSQAFNFNDSLLCLCYAVHSTIINNKLDGHHQGELLLKNMLTALTKNQLSGIKILAQELNRTLSSFFGYPYKIPLDSENFQCALLRHILQDKNLLKVLGVKDTSEEQFNQDSRVRNDFRESLIQNIDKFYIGASNILPCNFTL